MTERTLTITLDPDWQNAVRSAFRVAPDAGYQGETLNFDSTDVFFSRLSGKRMELVRLLQGQGEVSLRALARRAGRDVKRVHEDTRILLELGVLERGDRGGIMCPFRDVHIDVHFVAQRLDTSSVDHVQEQRRA